MYIIRGYRVPPNQAISFVEMGLRGEDVGIWS